MAFRAWTAVLVVALILALSACTESPAPGTGLVTQNATGNVTPDTADGDVTGATDDSPDAAIEPTSDVPPPDSLPASGNASNAGAMIAGSLAVRSQTVDYGPAPGFLVEPESPGEYPGVVVIHEWWGLNDEVKQASAALASHGYRVLAVDLYNGSVATTREEAMRFVGGVDNATAVANMRAAASYLRQSGSSEIASFGWCFGGGQSLRLALSGEPLNATVIYYGQLETDPQRLSAIEWPVLGIFGAEDQGIPVRTVQEFNESLSDADVPHEVHIYDDVGHAFANPSGMNYAPLQTADAWNKTLAFLDATLRPD